MAWVPMNASFMTDPNILYTVQDIRTLVKRIGRKQEKKSKRGPGPEII